VPSAGPSANLFAGIPASLSEELVQTLVEGRGFRLERIVSTGHATPPGDWYEQPGPEWVVLLSGSARLRFEHETEARALGPGDHVLIAARRRHRVEWTDPAATTVWLALHF
jgi:cupin 2 domain-containing protein